MVLNFKYFSPSIDIRLEVTAQQTSSKVSIFLHNLGERSDYTLKHTPLLPLTLPVPNRKSITQCCCAPLRRLEPIFLQNRMAGLEGNSFIGSQISKNCFEDLKEDVCHPCRQKHIRNFPCDLRGC